jgi:hypothetical protein
VVAEGGGAVRGRQPLSVAAVRDVRRHPGPRPLLAELRHVGPDLAADGVEQGEVADRRQRRADRQPAAVGAGDDGVGVRVARAAGRAGEVPADRRPDSTPSVHERAGASGVRAEPDRHDRAGDPRDLRPARSLVLPGPGRCHRGVGDQPVAGAGRHPPRSRHRRHGDQPGPGRQTCPVAARQVRDDERTMQIAGEDGQWDFEAFKSPDGEGLRRHRGSGRFRHSAVEGGEAGGDLSRC